MAERVFEHPNMVGFQCPLCRTKADRPVVLVGIPGTEDDGIMQAKQIHAECYDLFLRMMQIEQEDSK